MNSLVELSSFIRPDQKPIIDAVNSRMPEYEDEPGSKRVIAYKCPLAFEWPENKAWNAEER